MSEAFGSAAAFVERCEGRIETFIGGAWMALFGVATAHEGDPLRALHAALERHSGVNTDVVVAGALLGAAEKLRDGRARAAAVCDEAGSDWATRAAPLKWGRDQNIASASMKRAPEDQRQAMVRALAHPAAGGACRRRCRPSHRVRCARPRLGASGTIVAMQVATATVVDGKLVIEGLPLAEGAVVTIITRGAGESFSLTEEQENELLAAMAEIDGGEFEGLEDLLQSLPRQG